MIEEKRFFQMLDETLQAGRDAVLVTVIYSDGSTPRDAGSRMIVFADGSIFGTVGGGELEAVCIKDALALLPKGGYLKKYYDLTLAGLGMACSGKTEVYFEVFSANARILLLGGGHVAEKIAKVASIAGVSYMVADDREEFANRDRFPTASRILVEPPHKAVNAANVDKKTYIVIVTRGHSLDQECLEAALGTEAAYIGMIGSASKIPHVFKNMNDKGFHPEKDPRIYTPIGLELGGKAPGEIAVSVMAEILKLSTGKSGRHNGDLRRERQAAHKPEAKKH